MNSKNQRSRKNLLILPGFQVRVILLVVVLGLICAIFNGYLFYSYVADSYGFILKYSNLTPGLVEDRYRELYAFGIWLIVTNVVATVGVAAWGLVVTHRAAGAIYHIKRVMGNIRSGNSEARVHLRKKDEFQDLADEFNQMMDELQTKK